VIQIGWLRSLAGRQLRALDERHHHFAPLIAQRFRAKLGDARGDILLWLAGAGRSRCRSALLSRVPEQNSEFIG